MFLGFCLSLLLLDRLPVPCGLTYCVSTPHIHFDVNSIPSDNSRHKTGLRAPCGHGHRRTIAPENQWRGRAEHLLPGDRVVHHAGVVAHIRRLHFGNVQAARLLRDETPTVLLNKVGIFVEDPSKCQL